jgi:hypothetical protein
MAIQNINVGNAANDGTGDDLREAFIKINQNFQLLDGIAEQVGSNLGSSGAEVYSTTTNNILYFRRLVAGTNIQLTQLANTIVVDNTMPEGRSTVVTNSGSIITGSGINYNILGADAITVSANENTKTITITGSLLQDTTPELGGNLVGNNRNITGINALTATTVNATTVNATDFLTTNIGGVNYQSRLGRYISGFDLGELEQPVESILDWVILQTGIDFGTIAAPSPGDVDLGSIV